MIITSIIIFCLYFLVIVKPHTQYDSSCAMGLKSPFVKFICLSNKEGYFSVFQNTRIEDPTKKIDV